MKETLTLLERCQREMEEKFAKGFHNGGWVLFYCPTSNREEERPATEEDLKTLIANTLKEASGEIGRIPKPYNHPLIYSKEHGEIYMSALTDAQKVLGVDLSE